MEEMSLEQGLEEIGHKILVLTRNELYMKMRFMDVALSAFYYVQDFSVDLLATDGETMYFNGQMLGGEYRQNRIEVNRAYLHLVLHCIFRHVFRRNGREELVWNLAADIAVESVIDDWNLQNIRKSQSWIRQRTYRDLKEEIKVVTIDIPIIRKGDQGIYSGKNLWSTGKMEAFGQRDGAHGPGIYRG